MNTTQTVAGFRKKRITEQAHAEKLLRDIRVVLQNAEELIKSTAGDIGERTRETRARLAGALVVTRESCNELERRLAERFRAANAVVRERPLETVAIAFGVGIIVGILLDRVWDHRG